VRAEDGARQPGQVRIRTSGGSEGRPARQQPRNSQQTAQESAITVNREFEGTLAEFREQLEKCMGGEQSANFTIDADRLVWQQQGDTGRIEMKAANRRVYLSGKAHQVRSLCMTVAPFCRQVGGDGASSVAGSRLGSRTGSRPGSEPGSRAGGGASSFAPSAAFAPSAVYAPSAISLGATSQTSGRGGAFAEPSKRVCNREFLPEGQGELEMKLEDLITVSHDPEVGEANINRWVHGMNERTKDRGWFPLSYTKVLQVSEDAEQP